MDLTRRTGIWALLILLPLLCCGDGRESPPANGPAVEPADPPAFSGRIVFQSNADGDNEIFVLSDAGLRRLTDNSWEDVYPVWSPGGDKIAFSSNRRGPFDIYVMTADGSQATRVTDANADEGEPAWFPDGRSLAFSREEKKFLRTNTVLYRVDLDTGAARRIIPRYPRSHGIPDISPEASLITFTGKRTFGWDVAVFDVGSRRVRFLAESGKSCRARFSRDGRRLAFVSSSADGKGDIWAMDPDGGNKARLTLREETYDYFPCWSPDGRRIVFNTSTQHDREGDWRLCLYDLETGAVTLLYDSPGNDIFPDWF
jgi:Tol biopolymer transport system component